MSEQRHHQGWSFLLVSQWLPWRKGPVFGRPAYFGYPLSYYEADVLSWVLKIKAAFRDTESQVKEGHHACERLHYLE